MKIYLDTGNTDEILDAAKTGQLSGVTTNPTLIAKEGKDFKTELKEIIKIMKKYSARDFTLSAEVTDLESVDSILKQARHLSKIDKHIVVKIPLTQDGLTAVKQLAFEGIRCNVTLCFSANQALLAAKAGAYLISPFIGRLDDQGDNGLHLIHEIRQIYDNYNFQTQILGASIRSPDHVLNCAKIGCDIVTIPYKIFKQLYHHELTNVGIEKFNKDWEKYVHKLEKNGRN